MSTRILPRRLTRRLRQLVRREDGTASVEFVLVLPVVFALLLSSAEAGFLQLRYVLLQRALDITVRELRLGQIPSPTHDKVKQEICKWTTMMPDCMGSLMVELTPVDTTNWTGLNSPASCVDRSEPLNQQVAPNFTPGTDDNLMLIRVCGVYDPYFPTIGLGLQITKDSSGAYHLVATSAFVNEPT